MTNNIFFISDFHLGHEKILTFKRDDATLMMDFSSIAEMNGTIVERWNSVVGVNDKVYILGDVAWGVDNLMWLNAMKGRKVLIKGNHDNLFNVRKFLPYFDDIHGVKPLSIKGFKCVLSHVPMHPMCLNRWDINIHGHTHSNHVQREPDSAYEAAHLSPRIDDRYVNVCCDEVDYTPVHLDTIIKSQKLIKEGVLL